RALWETRMMGNVGACGRPLRAAIPQPNGSTVDRRDFVGRSAAAIGGVVAASWLPLGDIAAGGAHAQGAPVTPISDDERRARIEKGRKLMTQNGISAIVLEGGTSMFYFTGVRWGNSERTFAVVIPAKGELAWVTPGFEEARARELIKFSNDVRVWQE